MRNTEEAIAWYKSHQTKSQIGFDPDGMCLKICRTARGIPWKYPSALSAQIATPSRYRVMDVADIRRGMIAYFDDARDSNPYGHIVTVVGRVPESNPESLSSLLVRTNSVKADNIVVVRGDYFTKHWGDKFQFAATWLNGFELPDFHEAPAPAPAAEPKPKAKKPAPKAPVRLQNAIRELEEALAYHKKENHPRWVTALERDIAEIKNTINQFS